MSLLLCIIVLLLLGIYRTRSWQYHIRHHSNDEHNFPNGISVYLTLFQVKSRDIISYNIMNLFLSLMKYVNLENILYFL